MKPTRFQDRVLRKIRFKKLWTPEHQDLFADYKLMRAIVIQMVRPFQKSSVEKVAAIDGVGFLLGVLIANELKIGLILVRKQGTIPSPSYKEPFIDYSKKRKSLEVKKLALIRKGERVLIVDDWAETGAHLYHTLKLLKNFQPYIVGISLLVNEMTMKQRKMLKGYKTREIIDLQRIKKPNW